MATWFRRTLWSTADEDKDKELYQAARRGDLTKVIDCHNRLANVNQTHGRTKCTPLFAATEGNFKPVVEELLKRGADGNFQSPLTGATALIQAARAGYADIVKMLVAYRSMEGTCAINVNLRNNRGETALFLAVREQHVEVVRILLDAGADTAFDYMVDEDSEQDDQDDFQVIQNRTIFQVAKTGSSPSNHIAKLLQIRTCPISGFAILIEYIKSFPPDKSWPIFEAYNLFAEVVAACNNTIFTSTSDHDMGLLVAKLTEACPNPNFFKVLKSDAAAMHLVRAVRWGPVSINGVNCFAVVMERGKENCKDLLSSLTGDNRVRCLKEVVTSVAFLHSRGFLHGDLKLENVVRFHYGTFFSYKLIDFDHTVELGSVMLRHCTAQYCPPEMAHYLLGSNPIPFNAATTFDIWCLGVFLLILFVPGGNLFEFKNLVENEAILRVIAADGFSLQRSIESTGLNEEMRKLIAQCLEPDPMKRTTTLQPLFDFIEKQNTEETQTAAMFAPAPIRIPCQLPCLWKLAIKLPEAASIIPGGARLKSMECSLAIAAVATAKRRLVCGYDRDGEISSKAESDIVCFTLPFLKAWYHFERARRCLQDLNCPTNELSFESPDLNLLEKTTQALEKIHPTAAPLAIEKTLIDWIGTLTDEILSPEVVKKMKDDIVHAFGAFCIDASTKEMSEELLNCIKREQEARRAEGHEILGMELIFDIESNQWIWMCQWHVPTYQRANSPHDKKEKSEINDESHKTTAKEVVSLPCFWTLEAPKDVKPYYEDAGILQDTIFSLSFQCELATCKNSRSTPIQIHGSDKVIRHVLPVWKSSFLLNECLEIASILNFTLDDGREFQLNGLNTLKKYVKTLETIHDSRHSLSIEAILQNFVDEANFDKTSLCLAFESFRQLPELKEALRSLGFGEKEFETGFGGLHKTVLPTGAIVWVCDACCPVQANPGKFGCNAEATQTA
ncbi:Aste57867_14535 [Aphanomyces stellatus]|uniref:Aste57867_14535 protein n=1 Tax=Aphanomyces stellatus TaxID=120398 RepID=A0A485L2K9_9STRA|nr:hypothetical protein As57867_014481 [Aphanomyces stellatus]VFT91357.1 Aste57867_14535 [Aphanomyces stellatus]